MYCCNPNQRYAYSVPPWRVSLESHCTNATRRQTQQPRFVAYIVSRDANALINPQPLQEQTQHTVLKQTGNALRAFLI